MLLSKRSILHNFRGDTKMIERSSMSGSGRRGGEGGEERDGGGEGNKRGREGIAV
jgi:hypothetical protein